MKYDLLLTGTVGAYPFTTECVAEALAEKDGQEELHVFLSSFGGDLQTALQVRALFAARGGVVCHLAGFVASAATVIATGAAETLIAADALYLVHRTRCCIDVFAHGLTADEIKKRAEALMQTSDTLTQADAVLAAIYAEKTRKDEDEMLALMEEEKWLTASEAVSLGFCDWEEKPGNTAKGAQSANALADVAKIAAAYGLPSPTGGGRKGGQWLHDLLAGFAAKGETAELRRRLAEAETRLAAMQEETGKAEEEKAHAAEQLAAAAEESEALKAKLAETAEALKAATSAREEAEARAEALQSEAEALKAYALRLEKADGAEDTTAGLATAGAQADERSVRARYEALRHLL